MFSINKYPRTLHIQGSRSQAGDENLENVPFSALKDKYDLFDRELADFLNTILDSGTHWIDRPIVPNQLAGEN